MATVQGAGTWRARGVHEKIWTPMTFSGADVGTPLDAVALPTKTAQVFGTLGAGGAVTLEGSNDGVNWNTMKDMSGAAMVLGLGVSSILDNPRFIRPRVTAGDGTTSLTVIVESVR
jgi:hypothetical protein